VANPYEDTARQRKAYAFSEYLHSKGVTAESLDHISHDQFIAHIEGAGLKSLPSAETMKKVKSYLEFKANLAANPMEDPFEGL
jgi:hypothetical protein